MSTMKAWTLALVAAAPLLGGCGNTYCQSGPKHGTQCYDPPRGDDPPFPQSSTAEEEPAEPPSPASPESPRHLPPTAPR